MNEILIFSETKRFSLNVKPKKSMTQPIKLSELLRDSTYKHTQFKAAQIQALTVSITMKDAGKAFVKYRRQGC
jgi:hypothetical protein